MEIASIGHNNPPEPTPFDLVSDKIKGLYGEAKNFLDGAEINSAEQADAIQSLLRMIQQAEKEADATRKDEAKPFDEAKAEIQERYNPLIGNTKSGKGLTVQATEACKKALAPWLLKVEADNRAKAEAARKEAEEKTRIAQEAMRQRDGSNLEENELAEALVRDAKAAEAVARRADSAKATVKGFGRAVGLRTSYVATVTDYTAFARYVWLHHRADMQEWLDGFAKQIIDRGNHSIDGVTVTEDRRVA